MTLMVAEDLLDDQVCLTTLKTIHQSCATVYTWVLMAMFIALDTFFRYQGACLLGYALVSPKATKILLGSLSKACMLVAIADRSLMLHQYRMTACQAIIGLQPPPAVWRRTSVSTVGGDCSASRVPSQVSVCKC